MDDCWIPPLEPIDNLVEWAAYEDKLYEIFRQEFILSRPIFRGLPVKIRATPKWNSREESFWHLTCRDYSHKAGTPEFRDPDIERSSRIHWARAFIENYDKCVIPCIFYPECGGVYIWNGSHKPKNGRPRTRTKLFLEEESYLLVLEDREDHYQLITAHVITEEWSLKSIKREMKKKGAIYAGSAG